MAANRNGEEGMEIDDSLYRYVLGDTAMHKMAGSKIFITGLGGLGVEIAKNVILAGVKSVTVHDCNGATLFDLSSQFFLKPEDVDQSRNRAEASLQMLKDLNPYVDVNCVTFPLDSSTDLSFLSSYQCIVCTDVSFELLTKINEYCRSQVEPIKFIAGSVRGVACYGFCDFGDTFVVSDKNGEEPVDFYISHISQSNPGVVSCLLNERHGLEDGDTVVITEVVGMDEYINNNKYQIKVVSSDKFSINVDTSSSSPYENGGRVKQIKTPVHVKFNSFSQEMFSPTYQVVDFSKMDRPPHLLLFFLTLDKFMRTSGGSLPHSSDTDAVLALAYQINDAHKLVDTIDDSLLKDLCVTCSGLLPPLASVLGGILAQEVLIAVTGKFSPLRQWLFIDALEVVPEPLTVSTEITDRYSALRACIGDELFTRLASLKVFMVGCGAIGCEMLKGYAMLGVGQGSRGGHIVITDNDTIEKSNLNRQFLFRPHHIQQHKSVIAAASIRDINNDLSIIPQQYKVFPGTEEKIYNDQFYQRIDIVVNALDNVEARRYIDSRCVTNMKPLLESGTLGTKGHVQVILPEMTESYGSQQDPPDKDIPYCTLKSFPSTIEHTIQWARDKFETLWYQKPLAYNKYWNAHHSPAALAKKIEDDSVPLPDGSVQAIKLLENRPKDWNDCIRRARIKFEKYFNHKALNLLAAFPLDTKMPDGSLFWQSPKRPPSPLVFSCDDPIHIMFVVSYSKLLAQVYSIAYTEQDLNIENIISIVSTALVPKFIPSNKRIETDENAKAPQKQTISHDKLDGCRLSLVTMGTELCSRQDELNMISVSFEKDDDNNGHIDFITASSNLRALMYKIETADRFKTKLIAGRIVPAIATTTATVAGLVSVELIKVAMVPRTSLDKFKNAFMNLALPELPVILSEPAPCARNNISESVSYTLWTRWEVKGNPNMTLKEFIQKVKSQYAVDVSMIVFGVKMIYVPLIPGHKKRLTLPMKPLLMKSVGQTSSSYVDLTLSYDNDMPGPPVRYYYQ